MLALLISTSNVLSVAPAFDVSVSYAATTNKPIYVWDEYKIGKERRTKTVSGTRTVKTRVDVPIYRTVDGLIGGYKTYEAAAAAASGYDTVSGPWEAEDGSYFFSYVHEIVDGYKQEEREVEKPYKYEEEYFVEGKGTPTGKQLISTSSNMYPKNGKKDNLWYIYNKKLPNPEVNNSVQIAQNTTIAPEDLITNKKIY